MLPALIAVVMVIMTGCRPSPQKLAEKMANGETLSEKEYTEVFEYTLGVLDVINDSITAHKGDFRATVNAMKSISQEYPESDIIVKKLMTMDPETLDEKNRALYDKLMAGIEDMGASMAESGPVFRASDMSRVQPNGAKEAEEGEDEGALKESKDATEAAGSDSLKNALPAPGEGNVKVLEAPKK